MKITQSFTVARPADAVWTFFQDIPAVAACLPGAELVESGADGIQRGKVGVSLGPFRASFEGEARVTADAANRSGHVEGRGIDKRGGSHSRMSLDYKLEELDRSTRVDIEVDLTLSGPIAQFGRIGLVTEAANMLVGEFARNLDARLSQAPQPRGVDAALHRGRNRISAVSVVLAVIRAKFKILFGRRPR